MGSDGDNAVVDNDFVFMYTCRIKEKKPYKGCKMIFLTLYRSDYKQTD
jgi:hypothetical protein